MVQLFQGGFRNIAATGLRNLGELWPNPAGRGLAVGLYYSPAEWGNDTFDEAKAYDDYFIAQVGEILQPHGPIDMLWFDGCGSEGHEYDWPRICSEIRQGAQAEAAKKFIYQLAPPYDPEAVDGGGRKLRKPNHNLSLLRARSRVHLALGELDKALADAEQVCMRQLSTDGGMSMKTDQLVADEAYFAEMKEKAARAK